jgi:hypothetical protein
MEALQSALVSKISQELEKDKPDTQLLDSYNRLLGTVSANLIANK